MAIANINSDNTGSLLVATGTSYPVTSLTITAYNNETIYTKAYDNIPFVKISDIKLTASQKTALQVSPFHR